MAEILWRPTQTAIKDSQMDRFRQFVSDRSNANLKTYTDLYEYSINDISGFWGGLWEFCQIRHSQPYDTIVDDPGRMPGAKWFNGARLNYAENLLRFRDDRTALIFKQENQDPQRMTYGELLSKVAQLAHALRKANIQPGDRIAGFLPNIPETVIAMLASASVGAIWSSSSPDFGINGVLDRFSQIEPKILFSANGYTYNGKSFNLLGKLSRILRELPTVEQVVVIPHTQNPFDLQDIPNGIVYSDFAKVNNVPELIFEQLPFDHPLYIMYSSGTTGLPKSIVHSAGGTLVQHLKELQLHTDLTRNDTIFYFTTCGWMMWNWLVSSLAVGATIVLYDGSPFHPDPYAMWKLVEDLEVTVFGTSAKYISACEAAGVRPARDCDLSSLRAILSTGSPLIEESFDYVYQHVKTDVMLSSISGGTDLISCFALGNPMLPVYRGELQCRGLGMAVEAFDPEGMALRGTKGELVCSAAFPSMPIYFWNDPEGEKYRKAYFETYPGIWHHGDYISINEHGGVKIYGRSDATLNPGGVRIGTAEIYRAVESLPDIEDSLVVGQAWEDDERVILFVKLKKGSDLSTGLVRDIQMKIRQECSPRHVPSKILAIEDIPYTINAKKVEIAVKKILAGEDVVNRDALANPESLDLYRDLPELRS